ncbi:MAG: 3TM-type holin [Candidatus Njordarchaeales archaeon]
MGGFLGQVANALSGGAINKIIDRVIPDKMNQEEKAKLAHELQMEVSKQEGKIEDARAGNIQAEAKSNDPWVSRARPTLMWVMYFVIIFNYIFIPLLKMTVLFIVAITGKLMPVEMFVPIVIPANLWYLFGVGYTGYAGARSYEKVKGGKSIMESVKGFIR